MKAHIIPIGNSKGVRIPKAILEQCHLTDEVELDVRNEQIVIRSSRKPRQNWGKAFQRMAAEGDDQLIDETLPTSWDKDEWKW